MSRSFFILSLLAVCVLYGSSRGDVPPDPGYTCQSASLTLETSDDLSDHRFFLESPIGIEEIKVVKDVPTVIGTEGRAGAARIGTLWAVPRLAVSDYPDTSDPAKLDGIRNALKEGRLSGAIKLLSHDFQATIREGEKASWKDPVYRLEKNGQGVAATLVSGGVQNLANGKKGRTLYSTEPKTPAFWTAVFGGSILTLAFIGLGAWFLRRSRSKAAERGF